MFNDLLVVFIQLVTSYVIDDLRRGDSTIEFSPWDWAATATDAAVKADADVEAGETERSLIVIVGYVGITLGRTRVRSQF